MGFGRTAKEFKLSKENAIREFDQIMEAFGFNISTETKERILTMKINSIEMQTSQELNEADSVIMRIMEGIISFDPESTEIIYKLKKPISTGENSEIKTSEIRFGQFTRAKQKSISSGKNGEKISLNQINFSTMADEQQDAVLMAMTGISDCAILNGLSITQYNDLRMIAGYFLT